MPPDVARVVALGASNLTRGFPTVVAVAQAAWGPNVEIVAALGHGRSYGAYSRVVVRGLPGILESGLWQALASFPEAPTRALVTDVGNDILYGFSAPQTLAWVAEAVGRLQRFTQDIVLTDLPLVSIRRLSRAKFLMFRTFLYPRCRLSFDQVTECAERVNAGLAELSATRGVRFFHLNPAWYGYDPIHIRPSVWRLVWPEILGSPASADKARVSRAESLRLHLMRPQRQWLLGMEQFAPQSGVALASGGRVWLY